VEEVIKVNIAINDFDIMHIAENFNIEEINNVLLIRFDLPDKWLEHIKKVIMNGRERIVQGTF
jgi:hypothetical protein